MCAEYVLLRDFMNFVTNIYLCVKVLIHHVIYDIIKRKSD